MIQVGRRQPGNNSVRRVGQVCQTSDIARSTFAVFDDQNVFVADQIAREVSMASSYISVSRRRSDIFTLGKDRRQHLFHRRLAVTTSDGYSYAPVRRKNLGRRGD